MNCSDESAAPPFYPRTILLMANQFPRPQRRGAFLLPGRREARRASPSFWKSSLEVMHFHIPAAHWASWACRARVTQGFEVGRRDKLRLLCWEPWTDYRCFTRNGAEKQAEENMWTHVSQGVLPALIPCAGERWSLAEGSQDLPRCLLEILKIPTGQGFL